MLRKLKKIVAKRKKLIIALGVLFVVFLIGRSVILSKNKGLTKESVKKGTVAQEMILSGEVRAKEDAKLFFTMPGELAWLGVKEGDLVKKGQVIARLDTTNLYASYEMANSDLRLAQATLDRVYDQIKGHDKDESFSQRETRTAAEVTKDKAYRALTIAQKNLSNAGLSVPFDGVITNITFPFTGINLMATNYLVQIINPKTFYFEVVADQTEVVDLKTGQKVEIKLDSFEETVEGLVEYISLSPIEGEAGATYRVKIKIEDWPFDLNKIKAGMTGDAKFILSERENVLYLPPKFINSDQTGKYVNLGKKNNKVYMETGIEGDDRVEVKGDINEGSVVYD